MNEPQWNQEAETFARVWQRVSPEQDPRPKPPGSGPRRRRGAPGQPAESSPSPRRAPPRSPPRPFA